MKYLYLYLLVMNLAAFALMGIDKHRAIRHRWRISERALFLAAILGGSVGGLLGMWIFRHKTRHSLFAIGFPLVLVIHLVLFFVFTHALA